MIFNLYLIYFSVISYINSRVLEDSLAYLYKNICKEIKYSLKKELTSNNNKNKTK